MNALIALTLTGALSGAPAAPAAVPAQPEARRAPLALLVEALVNPPRRAALEVTATRAARQPGDDSLKNGATIGGVVAGVGMGAFVYTLCRALDDTGGNANCAGPALLWGGIFGAGGAAVGAGVDALFEKQRVPTGKIQPGRVFRLGVRF